MSSSINPNQRSSLNNNVTRMESPNFYEVPAVNTSTLSDSKARGKALKIDFKSMYADFHIAGNSL